MSRRVRLPSRIEPNEGTHFCVGRDKRTRSVARAASAVIRLHSSNGRPFASRSTRLHESREYENISCERTTYARDDANWRMRALLDRQGLREMLY